MNYFERIYARKHPLFQRNYTLFYAKLITYYYMRSYVLCAKN